MGNIIDIEIEVVAPVDLEIEKVPVQYIGTKQVGPRGPEGPPGSSVIPDASETEKGIIQLATQAEVTTGTNNTKAVVPGTLKPELDKKAADEIPDLDLIFENQLI